MGLVDRIRRHVGDPALMLAAIAMAGFGVAMVYSAGHGLEPNPRLAGLWRAQGMWLGISIIAFLVLVRIPVQWYEWAAIPLYAVSLILLATTLAIGTGRGTAAGIKSWIDLGPLSFQPSQFANIATVLMVARVIGGWRDTPKSIWDLWKPILIVAAPLVLILGQPDLGTAMVLGAVLLATLFWGGVPAGILFMIVSPLLALFLSIEVWVFSVYMLLLIAFVYFYRAYLWESVVVVGANLAAGTIALPLWNSLEQYQKNRFLVFLDPTVDPQGAGYQVIQSRIAIGSGGLFGKGYTLGTQKGLNFLPEPHTDFIFAVVGEELGFLGAAGVVLAFGFVLWRMTRVAERTPDPFAGIVVFGIFGAWFAHVLVNIGMTIGIMPITGIPLPFLSYGGSFLLANFIALALVQRVASEEAKMR